MVKVAPPKDSAARPTYFVLKICCLNLTLIISVTAFMLYPGDITSSWHLKKKTARHKLTSVVHHNHKIYLSLMGPVLCCAQNAEIFHPSCQGEIWYGACSISEYLTFHIYPTQWKRVKAHCQIKDSLIHGCILCYLFAFVSESESWSLSLWVSIFVKLTVGGSVWAKEVELRSLTCSWSVTGRPPVCQSSHLQVYYLQNQKF